MGEYLIMFGFAITRLPSLLFCNSSICFTVICFIEYAVD